MTAHVADGVSAKQGLSQPAVGLIGLAIVLVVFWLLGMSTGLEHSLLVFGPISTFMLPLLAMMALWWGGLPGTTLGRLPGGLLNTVVLVVGAVALTLLGQAIVGVPSLAQTFGTAEPTAASLPTFPFTMPLAAAVFIVFLQLTFVCRMWPFAGLNPVGGGLAAFGTAWGIGLVLERTLTNWDGFIAGNAIPPAAVTAMGLRNPGGPIDALEFVGLLLCIVILQMIFFFVLEGWPVSLIKNQAGYLVAANLFTIVGGIVLWQAWGAAMGGTAAANNAIGATAGVVVAGTLTAALLMEAWPARLAGPSTPFVLVALSIVLAVVFYVLLGAIAGAAEFTKAPPELWVSIGGLNFFGAMIIVHAVLWRRWPIPVPPPAE